jgi:hypothetical protein
MNRKIYLILLLVLFASTRSWAQCVPTVGFLGATGDYVDNFTFNTLSNLASGDNATDYALYPQTTSVVQGLTYPFTMAPGGSVFSQGLAIWIDYNGNNLFTDPGEFVWSTPGAVFGPSAQTGNVTVPITAVPGVRRMRICAKYFAAVVATESCGHTTFGEYEDYNITILANTPCSGNPTAGTATASPTNPCPGVTVNFGLTGNSLVGGLTYQWISSTTNSAPWTVIPTGNVLNYSEVPPSGVTTYYRCIVTCTSSSGFDTSVAVPVTVQPWSPTSPCYCASAATTAFDQEILNVTVGTLNNTTTCATPFTGSQGTGVGTANQFADFTGVGGVPAPVIFVGLATPISLEIGTCGGSVASSASIFIDYNHDADFSDPGEEIYTNVAIASVPSIVTGSFIAPPTALPGVTRMRVITMSTWIGTITPCLSYGYGETEDYLVNILPPSPYDPAITNITSPGGNCFTASQILTATIRNYGSQPIVLGANDTITVYLHVNGPSGLTTYTANVTSANLLAYGGSTATAIFTGVNMFAGGTYSINTSLSITNNFSNGNIVNDSLVSPIIKVNYRPTPGAPYQLCQYSSIPFGQGLTVSGCAAPLTDSVTINFTLAPTTNPTAASVLGSAMFASANVPTFPPGTQFISCDYRVTNLATALGGWALETRFPLFVGTVPVTLSNVYYPSVQGNASTGSANYTWVNNPSPAAIGNLFSAAQGFGGVINMGYHSTWGGNSTSNGYTLNAGSNPTVATLKIIYQYVPASFNWFTVPSGPNPSIYSLSPFDPLITTGSGLSNSNTPGTYTFYAACSSSPTCRTPVQLQINPTPAVFQDTLSQCEYAVSSNAAIFDLNTLAGPVSNNNPLTTVTFNFDPFNANQIVDLIDTFSTNFIYAQVSYATGCSSTDSVLLEVLGLPEFPSPVLTGFACAPGAIDVTNLIDPLSTTPVGTDTLYYSDPAFTIPHPNPNNITAADTVYMVFATNTNPVCSDTAIAYVDIIPANNYISGQVLTPSIYSNAGSYSCMSTTLADGMSDTIRSTTDCRRVAAVTDITNGTSLGTVSACLDIAPSTPFYNGQPYVNRAYTITPTTNDTGYVCLYYLDQDFQDYNADAFNLGWPMLPTAATMPSNMQNLAVTKVSGGALGTVGSVPTAIPNSSVNASYDPATSVWTICVPAEGFSQFYVHAQNPGNAPLPVTLLSFTGRSVNGTSDLNWITSMERNNSHFVVERSRDGKNYSRLSDNIASKAPNGNSDLALSYGYVDTKPFEGYNYYRLQQHDVDGKMTYSNVINVYFGNETMVTLYPNPVSSLLNVDINTPKATTAQVKITDATGRVVRVTDMTLQAGSNQTQVDLQSLADGVYMVNITNGKGLNYSQPVRKN